MPRSLLLFLSLIQGHTGLLIGAAKGKEKKEANTVSKFPGGRDIRDLLSCVKKNK